MRLRIIVMVLSVVALMSSTMGGYFYYSALKDSAIAETRKDSASRSQELRGRFSSFLIEQARPVKALAGLEETRSALCDPNGDNLHKVNRILDHFNVSMDSSVCYLMDTDGVTLASSNRNQTDSFVGKNFSFRPYFQEALKGKPSIYMGLGVESGSRGVYYSHPVKRREGNDIIGVAVIKATMDLIEKELNQGHAEMVLLADPHGMIFVSSRPDWLFHTLERLSPEEELSISNSRQFGKGPFPWTGLVAKSPNLLVDQSGHDYLSYRLPIDGFSGWSVVYLQDLASIYRGLADPFFSITAYPFLPLCILVGLSVGILYRTASRDIVKRKVAEEALRESEERYRYLYNNTPGMLHSVDPKGRLISVSDYWLNMLGYNRDEVVGKKLSNFLTEDSRWYADEVALSEFLEKGYLSDISYQFRKKNGDTIDVLLSAIAERDANGRVRRSLAVLVDVTEQKRAEAELRITREQLRKYSEELELQVAERTEAINSILKNTPSMVFLKDPEFRYLMVNSKFEDVLGLKEEQIVGHTDYDIFPTDIAHQFRINDTTVMTEKGALQVEERFPYKGASRIYLSAKFPLYNKDGSVQSLCGIASDITEIKKAQFQLRRLSASIMSGQEKERTAIARELHDELGQALTALRFDAVWIRDHVREVDPVIATQAGTMCVLIDKTIDDVRGIALRLRPGVLDDLGLIAALEWIIGDFRKRTRIDCEFLHEDVPDIPNIVATAAYRIAQEALTNVARHSNASHVEVSLAVTGNALVLTVADNGVGFDIMGLSDSEGLGLAGMRERASLVGGVVDILSGDGRGVRVFFRVPIDIITEGFNDQGIVG